MNAVYDFADAAEMNTEFFGDLLLLFFALHSADRPHVVFGQLGLRECLSLWNGAVQNFVGIILGFGRPSKVLGVNTPINSFPARVGCLMFW